MDEKLEKKLITDLALASLKEQRSRRRWGIFFKLFFFAYVIFLTVIVLFDGDSSLGGDARHVAVIPIHGVIGVGESVSSDVINGKLRRAFKSEATAGVILDINSPGGSAVESHRIYKEIRRLREKYPDKKLYAVVGDLCASGGYFIAAAADDIYGDEASVVGSIGVIFSSFGFVEAMEKLGIERRVQTAGKNKNLLDPFSPQTLESAVVMDGILSNIHDVFTNAVKQGRQSRISTNAEIYSGAVFGGNDSVRLGLIDGFNDVGGVARDIIGVEDVVYYKDDNIFNKVLSAVSARLGWYSEGIRAEAR